MICKRLSSRIALLGKIIVFLPSSQRLLYYNAIICQVLSYVSVSGHSATRSYYIEF